MHTRIYRHTCIHTYDNTTGTGFLREANDQGVCVCADLSVQIGTSCVMFSVILPAVIVPFMSVLVCMAMLWYRRERRKQESLWCINIQDLVFDNPPKVRASLAYLGFQSFLHV